MKARPAARRSDPVPPPAPPFLVSSPAQHKERYEVHHIVITTHAFLVIPLGAAIARA
jgi:hypothetical protein